MPLTEKEKNTQALYDANCREWLSGTGGSDRGCFWEKEAEFFRQLPEGSLIADIGAGPSTDSKYFKKFGLNVVSLDYSLEMLRFSQELKTNEDLVQASIYQIPLADESLDGFWASAIILHLENPDSALGELSRVTKKGGIGFLSIKEGEGDMVDPHTGFYYHYLQDSQFQELLKKHGFEVQSTSSREGRLSGRRWLTYSVRKI